MTNNKKIYASILSTALATSAIVVPVGAQGTDYEVEVTNSVVAKKDTVLVKAVPANATVKVYLAENDTIPAFTKKQGKTKGDVKATLAYDLPVPTGDTGSVFVTVTLDGEKEGTRQAVAYDKEPVTEAPTLDESNKIEVVNGDDKDSLKITLAEPAAASSTSKVVRVGSTVKVYNEKDVLLGSAKVAKKGTVTNVTLKEPLANPESDGTLKLKITFTNEGQAASEPVEVTYGGEKESDTTGSVATLTNGIGNKDTLEIVGLSADRVATVAVYKEDPTGKSATELKALLLGSGKSKVVTTEDESGNEVKDGQVKLKIKGKDGLATHFPVLGEDTKVYYTVKYDTEHPSKPVSVAVTEEKKTLLVVGDAVDAKTGAVVVTTENKPKGADLVTVEGAAVGSEILIYDAEGKLVVGKAKVKASKDGEPTLTNVKISKGFSSNTYSEGAEEAKYKISIENKDEHASDLVDFVVSNTTETQFTISEDNTEVFNNVTSKDKIVIEGLKAKTVVTVYSEDPTGKTDAEKKKLQIAKATPKLASKSDETGTATITVTKGFAAKTEVGKVFVEIAEPDTVGKISEVSVPAEANTQLDQATLTIVNGIKKDTVTLKGLTEGDIIKVYNGLTADGLVDSKKQVGTAKVKASGEATVSLKALTTKKEALDDAEVLYVTVQSVDKAPVFVAASDLENKVEVTLAVASAESASMNVPVENITSTPSLTLQGTDVTAKSFGFTIGDGTADLALAAKDVIKIYKTEDDEKPVATVNVSQSAVEAKKVVGKVALDLSSNEEVEFWYSVTTEDSHESERVASVAHFEVSDEPTVEVSDTTSAGVAVVTVSDVQKGDVVKIYDGTRVLKNVKATVDGDLTINLTGVKVDADYDVTLTQVNKAEGSKVEIQVLKYVAE